MDIKHIFNAYRNNQREVVQLKKEIESRKMDITPSRTSHWEATSAYSKGRRSDPTANIVLKRIEDEEIVLLEARREILETDIKCVEEMISCLPQQDRIILEKRFIYGHSVRSIAIELGKSEYSVYKTIKELFNALEPYNDMLTVAYTA